MKILPCLTHLFARRSEIDIDQRLIDRQSNGERFFPASKMR